MQIAKEKYKQVKQSETKQKWKKSTLSNLLNHKHLKTETLVKKKNKHKTQRRLNLIHSEKALKQKFLELTNKNYKIFNQNLKQNNNCYLKCAKIVFVIFQPVA